MIFLVRGIFTTGCTSMSKPANAILSTQFATLKNSQTGIVATITVPGSAAIGAGASAEWHTDIPITTPYALAACRIASSKNSSRSLFGNATDVIRNGSLGLYDIYCFVWRLNSTTVRFQALIQNPYGSAMTGEAGNEVFSLYMHTFVPPF